MEQVQNIQEITLNFLGFEIDLKISIYYSRKDFFSYGNGDAAISHEDFDILEVLNIHFDGFDVSLDWASKYYNLHYSVAPLPTLASFIRSEIKDQLLEICADHCEYN